MTALQKEELPQTGKEAKSQPMDFGKITVVRTKDEVELTAALSQTEQIIYRIGPKGPNGLLEFKSVFLQEHPPAPKSPQKLFCSETDCFGPYILMAAAGRTDPDEVQTFTGGNHGYENTGETGLGTKNTATARMIRLSVEIDGKELLPGESKTADSVRFFWTNAVQASNTKEPDGSGREVLLEEYEMCFQKGIFFIRNQIKLLEDCRIECYYGLQMPTDWAVDGIRYLNAADAAWNPTDVYSCCKDRSCTGFLCRRGELYCEVCIDPTVGLGTRKYLHSGAKAFHMGYQKAYLHLIHSEKENFLAGSECCYQGTIRFFRAPSLL